MSWQMLSWYSSSHLLN